MNPPHPTPHSQTQGGELPSETLGDIAMKLEFLALASTFTDLQKSWLNKYAGWLRLYHARFLTLSPPVSEATKGGEQESLRICRANIADMSERLALLEPVRDRIRKEHAEIAAHNKNVPGMPYGPCTCLICKPDLEEIANAQDEAALSATKQTVGGGAITRREKTDCERFDDEGPDKNEEGDK